MALLAALVLPFTQRLPLPATLQQSKVNTSPASQNAGCENIFFVVAVTEAGDVRCNVRTATVVSRALCGSEATSGVGARVSLTPDHRKNFSRAARVERDQWKS